MQLQKLPISLCVPCHGQHCDSTETYLTRYKLGVCHGGIPVPAGNHRRHKFEHQAGDRSITTDVLSVCQIPQSYLEIITVLSDPLS